MHTWVKTATRIALAYQGVETVLVEVEMNPKPSKNAFQINCVGPKDVFFTQVVEPVLWNVTIVRRDIMVAQTEVTVMDLPP